MANNVNIQVNALGNFTQLKAQVAELKMAMLELQKIPLAGDSGVALGKAIGLAQSNFDKMLLSTRAFNVESVKMTDSVDKFGNNLQAGKLKLHDYFNIWRQEAKGTAVVLDDLAARQARVAKSTVIPDALKPGYAKVITSLNADLKTLGAVEEANMIRAKAYNSVVRGLGNELVNLGKNTQWAGRQLTVGLSVPLAAIGAVAGKAFLAVDQELTRMAKVYGDGLTVTSQQTIGVLRKDTIALATELAKTYGMSAQQTAATAADLAATGLQGQDLLNATRETMRLTTLGEMDQATAIKATIALQRTFKLSSTELADSVNYLNAVENQTSTSLSDLVEGLPRAAVVVKELGGSYKDLSAMMVAMREAGVPAAEAANSIKSAMASMLNPSKKASASLKAFGIDMGAITTKNAGNLVQMVTDLQTGLDKLDPLTRTKLIEQMFGKFQFAKVTALLDNLGKAGSQSQKAFQLAGATSAQLATLAEQELKQQTESASGRFKRAIETLKVEFLPIGEKFVVFGTKILNVFSKVLDTLNKMGPLRNVLVGALGVGAIIGPVIMLAGLLTNLVGNLFKGAQYAKLFASGFKDGGIKTALSSMTNYFEQIDISSLAASENTDFLTKSAVGATEAFAVLNKEVGILASTIKALSGFSTQSIVSSTSEQLTTAALRFQGSKYTGVEAAHHVSGTNVANAALSQLSTLPAINKYLDDIGRARITAGKSWETSDKKNYLKQGFTSQYSYLPSDSPAAKLQQKQSRSEVVYGPLSSVKTEQEMFDRERTRLVEEHSKLLKMYGAENINVLEKDKVLYQYLTENLGKAEITLEQLKNNPEAIAKIDALIGQTVMSQEEFYLVMQEQLRLDNMIFKAKTEDVKALIAKIKMINEAGGSNLEANLVSAYAEFEAGMETGLVQEADALTAATMDIIRSAESTIMASVQAIEAQATIINQIPVGDIRGTLIGTHQGTKTFSSSSIPARTAAVNKFFGRATGGYISGPGTSTSDSIPARLSNGEFVMNAKAVQTYGSGFMDSVNTQKFAGGGLVGRILSKMGIGSSDKSDFELTKNIESSIQLRGFGQAAASATENLGLFGKVTNRVKDSFGNLDKSKMFKPSSTNFGGMMAGQMVGMGMQTMAGKMQPGIAQSAMGDAAMGLQMGSMLGPYGMAAGVIGGALFGLVKKSIDDAATKNKNTMAALTDSISLDATAMDSLGIKTKDFSKIVLSTTSTIAGSGDAISKAADAYKAATDQQTQSALAHIKDLVDGGKSADIMAEAQRRYNTELIAGADAATAAKDTLGFLKAGGVGPFALNNISKGFLAKTPQQALTQNLDTLYKPYTSDPRKNETDQLIAQSKYNNSMFGSIGQTMFSAASTMNLEEYSKALDNVKNKSVFTKEAFSGFNAELKKQNPELATLNEELLAGGASTENLYKASKLAAEGAFATSEEYKAAARSTLLLSIAQNQLALSSAQAATSQGLAAKAAAIDAKVSSGSSGDSTAQQIAKQRAAWAYQDNIQKRQNEMKSVKDAADAQIKAIQDEMKARNDANSTLDKEIQDKKTLSDLANDVKRAEAGGDLLAMASAQDAYNQELAKQKREQDQIAKDKADQAKIDKITADADAKIAKMQADLDAIQANKEKADRAETIKGLKTQAAATSAITVQSTKATDASKLLEDTIASMSKSGTMNIDQIVAAINNPKSGMKKTFEAAGLKVQDIQDRLDALRKDPVFMNDLQININLKLKQNEIAFEQIQNKLAVIARYDNVPKGSAPKLADGGHITGPGGPRDDAIPAYLSNGEYVVQASSVAKYGKDFFDGVNAGHFATGGLIGMNDSNYDLNLDSYGLYGLMNNQGKNSKVNLTKGITLDPSTKRKIGIAQNLWKHDFDVVKGGYLPWDPFSLGTHMGGGVFDTYYGNGSQRGALRHPTAALRALKTAGFAPMQRTNMGANNIHIHAVEIGNPNLAPDTKLQVAKWKKYGKYAAGGMVGNISKPSYNTSGAQRSFGVGSNSTNSSAAFNDNKVYNISVSVETNASADDIANKIMKTIERNNRALGTNRTMGGRA